jgi:hypothetical protein
VVIPGAPEASSTILAVEVDPLEITTSTGAVPKRKKVLSPELNLTVAAGSPAAAELDLWWQDAAQGKCIRKDITINLRRSDGSTGRSYEYKDCFPVQWSSVNFDTSSTVQSETLTVKVGRIEFKT